MDLFAGVERLGLLWVQIVVLEAAVAADYKILVVPVALQQKVVQLFHG
jgi:hypothetical protein